jgi:phosphoglycolate phosphatase
VSVPDFPVYLFDVDGTLLDSHADICGAIQDVLSTTRQNAVSDEFLRRYIGRHLNDLFQDLLPELTAVQMEAMIADYRRIYLARNHTSTLAFPGVAEALAALPGRKATATTKGTPTTRLVLEKFGLLPFFDHVQGTDGFPAKPEPDVIFASLRALGATPEDCLLVGDAPADIEAGRRAGVKTCAVLWGYGDREELARWTPDYWISDPSELASSSSDSRPV